jgi:hypothetical protein
MLTIEDLEAMTVEQIEANFYALVDQIVTEQGDEDEATGEQTEEEEETDATSTK